MVGDRADAMLEVMDEARHEGRYRRIEVITGRRQRRNWTDEEKARILAESAEPGREHLGDCPALGRQPRSAERLAARSRTDLSTIRESLRAAGDVRAGDGGWR